MKHRLVSGSQARCTIALIQSGSRPEACLPRHASRAHAPVSHGYLSHPRGKSTSSRETWVSTPHLRPSIHPHSSTEPSTVPLPMGEQLRHMMRLLPHGVAICTSASSSSPDGDLPRGMTVSSFNSLSLTPPLVTFHVATPSRTLDAIRSSGRLNFHVLAGDARGAKAAHHFTGGNARGDTWSMDGLKEAGLRVAEGEGREGEGKVPVRGVEAPVLEGDGVMYVLRCRLFDDEPATTGGVVMVKDHAIVVAEVLEIIETSEKTDGHEQFGLVYADRHYRMLGRTLVWKEHEDDAHLALKDSTKGEEYGQASTNLTGLPSV